MNLRPITIWKRFDDAARRFEHNHIEDGHIAAHVPVGKFDEQTRNWANALWVRLHAHLDANNICVPSTGGVPK